MKKILLLSVLLYSQFVAAEFWYDGVKSYQCCKILNAYSENLHECILADIFEQDSKRVDIFIYETLGAGTGYNKNTLDLLEIGPISLTYKNEDLVNSFLDLKEVISFKGSNEFPAFILKMDQGNAELKIRGNSYQMRCWVLK